MLRFNAVENYRLKTARVGFNRDLVTLDSLNDFVCKVNKQHVSLDERIKELEKLGLYEELVTKLPNDETLWFKFSGTTLEKLLSIFLPEYDSVVIENLARKILGRHAPYDFEARDHMLDYGVDSFLYAYWSNDVSFYLSKILSDRRSFLTMTGIDSFLDDFLLKFSHDFNFFDELDRSKSIMPLVKAVAAFDDNDLEAWYEHHLYGKVMAVTDIKHVEYFTNNGQTRFATVFRDYLEQRYGLFYIQEYFIDQIKDFKKSMSEKQD